MKSIGIRLKHWRKNLKGFTLEELSQKTGIGLSTISEVEKNKYPPSGDFLEKLILNTDIGIYWLLTGEGLIFRPSKSDWQLFLWMKNDPIVPDIVNILRDNLELKMLIFDLVQIPSDVEKSMNNIQKYIKNKIEVKKEVKIKEKVPIK